MIAILQLLIFLLLLPYILFGVVLAKIAEAVCTVFQPVLLLLAVWIASLGVFLVPSMMPNDRPWLSLVDSIAQSHVLGVPTPFGILGVAVCVLIVSVIARQRRPAN
ncbi:MULTISPECIES: hypothetical protein [Pseudomonas]|jgi:hypothetical protein|uniref:Transmembrane protein n=4 Tax=Pseudomonas TaxID=286 RepID=A0A3G1DGH8_PSEAI|nr:MULTISPECIES: hypothetical protein [Pseudomonas]AXQ51120.1 hypothetical protein DZC31_31040 [Stenotrophomonas rhizophila]MCO6692676.1 hypothetical protein [Pseudomonas shirazica]AMP35763.1 Hypothetical protein [Pseudomonas aeruginosa]ESW38581.1 hypothetical protein O164_16920 [Pseudomonas taiwanensis SJ9]MBA6092835.1 hypothetical protein [Pseudomonas monteilii]